MDKSFYLFIYLFFLCYRNAKGVFFFTLVFRIWDELDEKCDVLENNVTIKFYLIVLFGKTKAY